MSKDTQRQWLRRIALAYLAEIGTPLSNLERLADGARAMPSPLRHRLLGTIKKVEETAEAIRSWAITGKEKADQLVEDTDRVPTRT